ncbi:hypothetical protein S7711_11528 [Stachybotrys chartarum IBT 7711]|uniref:Uncharacterized protein n=1 Tax=Stachybotrys chartarum (strain CBS 109288 / IBT 7711) TaxID=1280523 RepID=A0A084AEY5_STACB|nr:hypothetical protein S7711_11528 [Stachybotrys chartarum IBT 7711]
MVADNPNVSTASDILSAMTASRNFPKVDDGEIGLHTLAVVWSLLPSFLDKMILALFPWCGSSPSVNDVPNRCNTRSWATGQSCFHTKCSWGPDMVLTAAARKGFGVLTFLRDACPDDYGLREPSTSPSGVLFLIALPALPSLNILAARADVSLGLPRPDNFLLQPWLLNFLALAFLGLTCGFELFRPILASTMLASPQRRSTSSSSEVDDER